MSWKMTNIINERMKFVVLAQEKSANKAALCREFGITRTCGYKWVKRFKKKGLKGLQDQSRRPLHFKDGTPAHFICEIVRLRKSHPTWGGRKIRAKLQSIFEKTSTARTIDRILVRCGLVMKRREVRKKIQRSFEVQTPTECNDIWTVDLKGWWKTLDGQRVEPFTLRDAFSKFVLAIQAIQKKDIQTAKAIFIEVFSLYGLPLAILCDNGTPWAFHRGLCGLTRLSVWWMKLGICPIFIPLGSPQYNGAHERLHLDMMRELESSPATSVRHEQDRFDDWRWDYNHERPHQALQDKCPANVYRKSRIKYTSQLEDIQWQYPPHFHLRRVLVTGKVNWKGKTPFLSKAIANETVAFEIINGKKMNIWFHDYCLAYTSANFSQPIVEYELQQMNLDMRKKVA